MTMTANESRLSSDFGASVSFVCACACVCVLVCRVDLLDNLRAHFQSHSVWLKSLSGVKFSITLTLQAAHLKLCAAISYLVILLNKMIRAPDVAADGWINLLILCGRVTRLPLARKLLIHSSCFLCSVVSIRLPFMYLFIVLFLPLHLINHTHTLGLDKFNFRSI